MVAPALEFDLSCVSAREMASFFEAARKSDIPALAAVMAKVVVACPWGDPRDSSTYLDLPFFGAFQDVIDGLADAAKNGGARSGAPPT
jgi:hypothetical protein